MNVPIDRARMTKGEMIAMMLTCAAVFLAMLFVPSFISGQDADSGAAQVVPKSDTYAYHEFTTEFEAEHGRPWDVDDQVQATRNGAFLLMFYIFPMLAVAMLFTLAHDLRCYFHEKKLPAKARPMSPKTQAIRSSLYLVLTALFLIGMAWSVAMMRPVT